MSLRLLNEGFLFAFKSVVVNKLRTFLSLFGITIGIFCIISVFTVLDWMEKSIRDAINSMGSNVVYVQKFPWSFDGNLAWWDIMKWPSISISDYQSVKNKSTKAEAVSFLIAKSDKVKYKNNVANDAPVAAVTNDMERVVLFEIAKGRYFSPFEY
jgi:putative ABC transport system permease protein